MILKDLKLVPNGTFPKAGNGELEKKFFALKHCPGGGCFTWGGNEVPQRFIPSSGAKSLSLADDLVKGTISGSSHELLSTPLSISQLRTLNYDGSADVQTGVTVREGEDSVSLEFANRDLTLNELMESFEGHFAVDASAVTCPLTREEQRQSCAEGNIPFDPTEDGLNKLAKEYYQSKDFKSNGLGEKLKQRQNSKGFAYSTVFVDQNGNEVPDSLRDRHTINIFRLLNVITRPACPGWKIKAFALNGHVGSSPYAYFRGPDGSASHALRTRSLDMSSVRDRSEELYVTYASGAELTFNLCYSLDITDTRGSGIGSFFMNLDPARNPVAVIHGAKGRCVTFSGRSDSPMVPPWVGKMVGADYTVDQDTWTNPRLR
jgi:hypothetical protein